MEMSKLVIKRFDLFTRTSPGVRISLTLHEGKKISEIRQTIRISD